MRYTVYDNADGGFTIKYEIYDSYSAKTVQKKYQTYFKDEMRRFTNQLEKRGYKFVGKL